MRKNSGKKYPSLTIGVVRFLGGRVVTKGSSAFAYKADSKTHKLSENQL